MVFTGLLEITCKGFGSTFVQQFAQLSVAFLAIEIIHLQKFIKEIQKMRFKPLMLSIKTLSLSPNVGL